MTGPRAVAKIPLDWRSLALPLANAEDALARLDERLRTSPIRDGWIARTHFSDAAAALWLEGELVHLEDLVLHDAGMDIRAPTHELTRAHAVLRARRRIADAAPGWALSPAGLEALRGRAGTSDATHPEVEDPEPVDRDDEAFDPPIAEDDEFAELFASVDAAIAHADKTLAGERRPAAPTTGERDPLVYDLDWDEDARLAEWRVVIDETRDLPPTLAAALAHEAWIAIEPLQRAPGLGRLLAAAVLRRQRQDTRASALPRRGREGRAARTSAKPRRGHAPRRRARGDRRRGRRGHEAARPLAPRPHAAPAKARRPPLYFPVAGADRVRALTAACLGRHDRQSARRHPARGAEPRRRTRPARGHGPRTISGVGRLVECRSDSGVALIQGRQTFASADVGGETLRARPTANGASIGRQQNPEDSRTRRYPARVICFFVGPNAAVMTAAVNWAIRWLPLSASRTPALICICCNSMNSAWFLTEESV